MLFADFNQKIFLAIRLFGIGLGNSIITVKIRILGDPRIIKSFGDITEYQTELEV